MICKRTRNSNTLSYLLKARVSYAPININTTNFLNNKNLRKNKGDKGRI